MPVLQALAYGYEQMFKIKDLARCFTGAKVRVTKNEVLAEYGPDRYAVGFDFGAIVFVNLPAEERTRVLAEIRATVATREPHPPLEEEFGIEIREGAPPHGEVRFERVIVPKLDVPKVEIITLLLAQSVAIDYYDEDLIEILGHVNARTEAMAERGRIPGSQREVTRFVGSALATKNQIIAALSVFDKPAATWESESLDRLHRDLRAMLEIDDRVRACEYKLRTIQDALEIFLNVMNTRRSLFLETAIVVLILIEIILPIVKSL